MPSRTCGNCGHRHLMGSKKGCSRPDCLCDLYSARPRPAPLKDIITQYMLDNSLTYRSIGLGGGVDAAQVWRVLNGKSSPTTQTLRGIAQGMETTMQTLIEWLGITWK